MYGSTCVWRWVSRVCSKCEMIHVTIHIKYSKHLLFLFILLIPCDFHSLRAKIIVARTRVRIDDTAWICFSHPNLKNNVLSKVCRIHYYLYMQENCCLASGDNLAHFIYAKIGDVWCANRNIISLPQYFVLTWTAEFIRQLAMGLILSRDDIHTVTAAVSPVTSMAPTYFCCF
jgi:hypothetical protein